MAKYTVDLDSAECRLLFDALAVRLAQSQRAVKAAKSDGVAKALNEEAASVSSLITKLTKSFAV